MIEPRGLEEAVGGVALRTPALLARSLATCSVPHSIHPHYIPAGRIVFVYERRRRRRNRQSTQNADGLSQMRRERWAGAAWKIIYYYLVGVDPASTAVIISVVAHTHEETPRVLPLGH